MMTVPPVDSSHARPTDAAPPIGLATAAPTDRSETERSGADPVEATRVWFDGDCPLCAREIDLYRRIGNGAAIEFVNAAAPDTRFAEGMTREAALARLHAQLPDGTVVSGGAAFSALWQQLPGFGWLGRLTAHPRLVKPVEWLYRFFLHVRPVLQRIVPAQEDFDLWLEREMRSNHAGESGAVRIYDGILAVTRDPALREFAEHHRATEARHLEAIETWVAPGARSRLLPLWRLAGFITGALPALFGPRAVHVTIDAVETFVCSHYDAQITRLAARRTHPALLALLVECRADEASHRNEAASLAGTGRSMASRLWQRVVGAGSAAGVLVARRF